MLSCCFSICPPFDCSSANMEPVGQCQPNLTMEQCALLSGETGGLMQDKAGITQLINWERLEPTGLECWLGLSAHAWLWVHHSLCPTTEAG